MAEYLLVMSVKWMWGVLLTIPQQGGQIFSGLAHFIKGGVFFWYGILTLGRWAGCFAELGWVNKIPPYQKKLNLTLAGVEHHAIKKHREQTQENGSVR
jgi:hypothetical protein